MSIRRTIEGVLLDGLEQLIREGSSRKYWNSNRATSDALVALDRCLLKDDYCNLRAGALQYLVSQSEVTGDGRRHWMEEVWDTSVATLALATNSIKYSSEIIEARSWLCSKYLVEYNSWNDEIWETLWALNVLSYLDRVFPIQIRCDVSLANATDWISRMVNTPTEGMVVNWSNTALFVLFGSPPTLPGLDDKQKQLIIDLARSCARTLLDTPINKSDDILWTPEAWSNALVLWAISHAKIGLLQDQSAFVVAKWFKDKISDQDLPTEDRAFSCIALYRYNEYLLISEIKKDIQIDEEHTSSIRIEEAKEKLKERIGKKLAQRIPDFSYNRPFITAEYYGYYSINIRKKFANVVAILILTISITFLSAKPDWGENKWTKWIPAIPIILGALATLAQLLNFTLWPTRKKENND